MHCEFCETPLAGDEPANVALLMHVQQNQACGQQFNYFLDNLRDSWTRSMSGA